MDQNRIKNAAKWFYEKVFTDEPIRPRTNQSTPKVPSLLRTARSLENGPNNAWQSRESVFIVILLFLNAGQPFLPARIL